MRPARFLVGLLPLALFAWGAPHWPQFYGPDRNGISPESNWNTNWGLHPPRLVWGADMHDDGYAGPSIADGLLFIQDWEASNSIVYAHELATGRVRWAHTNLDRDGWNYGYDHGTPTWDEGRLYTLGRFGYLQCFEARSGKRLWSVDLMTRYEGFLPEFFHSLSPFIDGPRLVVCPGGRWNPVFLDKTNGNLLWKGDCDDRVSYANPVLATLGGVKQYLLYMAQDLHGVDWETGRVMWSLPWPTRFFVHAAMPVVTGSDSVFISAGYNHGCASVKVEGRSARFAWSNRSAQTHFSPPLFYRGFLYANSDPDDLVCLDPESGATRWRAKGFEKGGFIIAGGLLIALGGRSGDLILARADPAAYVEISRVKNPLGGSGMNWTAPILTENHLVIRSKTRLAVYDLTPPTFREELMARPAKPMAVGGGILAVIAMGVFFGIRRMRRKLKGG